MDEVEEGLFGYGPDLLAGYTFLKEVLPITQFTQRDMGDYPEAYAENLEAAEEIVDLCEEQGIRVVFFNRYTYSNPPETEDLARIEEDLTALGGEFWDCNQIYDQLSIDQDTDFFDTLHFKLPGCGEVLPLFGPVAGGPGAACHPRGGRSPLAAAGGTLPCAAG